MSLDAARRFCLRMIADADFRAAVDGADDAGQRLRVARQSGFEFTMDELEAAIVEVAEADTVGDLLAHDERLGFSFARLVELQRHQLVPLYFDGPNTANAFFTEPGAVRIVDVRPSRRIPGILTDWWRRLRR